MKILLIVPPLILESGWGRYSRAVIDRLRKVEGLQIEVVEEGVDFPFNRSALDFFRSVYIIRRRAASSDVVHAFDGWPYGVYGYLAAIGTKKRLFINAIGTYAVAPLTQRVKRWFMIGAYRRAERIMGISAYTTREIRRLTGLNTAEVVHLGLDLLPRPDDILLRTVTERYINGHQPILLTVGAIKHRKGQLDTLCAVAKVKRHFPEILYIMVGSFNDRSYVEQIAEFARKNGLDKNYRIIESADDKELAALYTISDIVLLNSNNDAGHFEGFGLVCLEAASFAKPTIGSRDCGIEDAIENGYNGFLTNQGDSEDIAEKIMKLLTVDRDTFASHSKSFGDRFSWDKTVAAYVAYYLKKQ